MSVKIKEMMDRPEVLLRGNFACAGCGLSIAYRTAISALDRPIVVIPACCASVIQSLHPNVTYNVPTLNIAFAAHAAAASGISRAKKRRGEKATTVVWSGDGGTYDIGVATWSGAAERNEDIIHFCYDNGFYSNTGAQRSGATPRGATTTTTPIGKQEKRKSVTRIMAAHDVPYIATASIGYPRDLHTKAKKAANIEGYRFILIDAPCPTGWNSEPAITPELGKLAVKTGYFPLYEIENGKLTFSRRGAKYRDPSNRLPVEEYFGKQGRFKRMNPQQVEELKKDLQFEWDMLSKLE
ncbi:MAG: pyruvate synthase subunit beta [Candidatus Heimdallarchaeota archaeon]|nr:MAG: pyruvate synthase subunit beta [Candidatus Heimdallarchaeota archaeon]